MAFKILLMTYKVLSGPDSAYLSDPLTVLTSGQTLSILCDAAMCSITGEVTW